MTEATSRYAASSVKVALAAAILAIAGCSGLNAPTEQSIEACRPRAA
jgi:hypothetical protein